MPLSKSRRADCPGRPSGRRQRQSPPQLRGTEPGRAKCFSRPAASCEPTLRHTAVHRQSVTLTSAFKEIVYQRWEDSPNIFEGVMEPTKTKPHSRAWLCGLECLVEDIALGSRLAPLEGGEDDQSATDQRQRGRSRPRDSSRGQKIATGRLRNGPAAREVGRHARTGGAEEQLNIVRCH